MSRIMDIVILIMWLIAGISNLISSNIDKFDYFVCWFLLILLFIYEISKNEFYERLKNKSKEDE